MESEGKTKFEKVLKDQSFWCILPNGGIIQKVISYKDDDARKEFARDCFELGNYFATKEEAELALEKLKALKRLRDKRLFVYCDSFDYQLQQGRFNVEFGKNLNKEELLQADNDLENIIRIGGNE